MDTPGPYEKVAKEAAEEAKTKLEAAGATVTVK
jgi:ribosomal protein L7/L12